MRFIKNTGAECDLTAYRAYLESIRERLPAGAQRFLNEHYFDFLRDYFGRKSLHDSWVDCFEIRETGSGARDQDRMVNIGVKMLGPYHDGYHNLTYHNVRSYSMHFDRDKKISSNVGHSDWLVDEITLDQDQHISHEVLFSQGGKCEIICADISYEWTNK